MTEITAATHTPPPLPLLLRAARVSATAFACFASPPA